MNTKVILFLQDIFLRIFYTEFFINRMLMMYKETV